MHFELCDNVFPPQVISSRSPPHHAVTEADDAEISPTYSEGRRTVDTEFSKFSALQLLDTAASPVYQRHVEVLRAGRGRKLPDMLQQALLPSPESYESRGRFSGEGVGAVSPPLAHPEVAARSLSPQLHQRGKQSEPLRELCAFSGF